jgi:hypothetical protein
LRIEPKDLAHRKGVKPEPVVAVDGDCRVGHLDELLPTDRDLSVGGIGASIDQSRKPRPGIEID